MKTTNGLSIGVLRCACGVYPVEVGGEWRAPGKHEPGVIKRSTWYFDEVRSELEDSGLATFRPKPRTKTLWLIEPTDAGVEYMERLIEEQKPFHDRVRRAYNEYRYGSETVDVQVFLDNFFASFDAAMQKHPGTVELHPNELSHFRKFGRDREQMSISDDGVQMNWRGRELPYDRDTPLKKGEIRIGLASFRVGESGQLKNIG